MRGNRDLRLVAWGSVLCAVAALAIPLQALSLVFAAPLTLFAPGYAIVAVTFARRKLDGPRTLLLSLALSLTTLVLGGFLLNYAPGGIRGFSWAILLALVVVACCRGAALRRLPGSAPTLSRPSIRRRDAALLLGGATLAAAALVLAMTTLPAKNARGFTELWVTPQAGTVAGSAEIGVGSEEQHATSYILQTQVGSSTRVTRKFSLRPGETRAVHLSASPPQAGPVPITALLYRAARPSAIYRRVAAWIPVTRR
jgi:uncharacterized membrane protein